MRKIKITASQYFCLALSLIGLALVFCSGRAHLGILVPITIGVLIPFYSLAYTGRFTYLPKAKSVNNPITSTKPAHRFTDREKPSPNAYGTTKEYDLRDIPYPPRRKRDQPTSNLPSGNGLGPHKSVTKATAGRCALLENRPSDQLDSPFPEVPIGKTLPLFNHTDPVTTPKGEDVFVEQDSIFL